jgi:hypothetical protein
LAPFAVERRRPHLASATDEIPSRLRADFDSDSNPTLGAIVVHDRKIISCMPCFERGDSQCLGDKITL